LSAMLTAMSFSSDRAALGPMLRLPYDPAPLDRRRSHHRQPRRRAGLPALVLERHLGSKPDCSTDTAPRDSRAGDRYLLRSDRLRPAAEDRPHFYVPTFGRRIRRRASQLAALGGLGQRVPVDAVPLDKGPACAASQLPAPAHRRRSALTNQRRSTGTTTGSGNVRRRLPARCARADWRTIAVTICPGKSGHK